MDQAQTSKLEILEDNMEEEFEEYNVQEELVTVKSQKCGHGYSCPLMATPSVWSMTLLRSMSTSCSTRRCRSPSPMR
jgi:hypothetical protein